MNSLLLSTGKIGSLQLRNRVIMGSMHMGIENVDPDGERIARFYAERAKGEVGLIITGGSPVSPEGASDGKSVHIYNPDHKEVFLKITREVHKQNGKVALQLFHAGRYARQDKTGLQPVAPSSVPTRLVPELARELTANEIEELIEKFANGAQKAKEYGFDAIEIMGSEGYLINQFLSPVTNQRTDEWGGSLEKRMRFALEIVKRIRETVGSDYPIIFRASGIDLIPNSTSLEEVLEFVKKLEEVGVDAINVGIGWHESMVPTVQSAVPQAAYSYYSKRVKEVVDIPVITSNRINNPETATRLLVDGTADFVQMARPFLADANFVKKIREGKPHFINTCIGCNQSCLDKYFTGFPSSCLVNPEAGRERILTIEKANRPLQIAVVGGGPAGMEASRVLAEKGHHVTLYEKTERIGGQFLWAAMIPGKEDYAETVRYYENTLAALNVTVKLNHEATAGELTEYDTVIVASGVIPREVSIPGSDLPHVMNYADFFQGKYPVGDCVAIIGGGGIGVDVAHRLSENVMNNDALVFLMAQGIEDSFHELNRSRKEIHIMRRGRRLAEKVGKTRRWVTLKELQERNVNVHTEIQYEAITEDAVIINDQGNKKEIPVDTVIVAAGQEPNYNLVNELIELGFMKQQTPEIKEFIEGNGRIEPIQLNGNDKALFVIGGAYDANALDAEKAILEGAITARMIS